MPAPPADVAAYLAACPPAHQNALLALRDTILGATPEPSERLSYRIPTVFSAGRSVVSYASFTNHCSLFGGYLAAEMARQRPGIEVVASTVRFTPEKPLPKSLVVAIVKGRLAANRAAEQRKADRKKAPAVARKPAKKVAKRGLPLARPFSKKQAKPNRRKSS